MESPTGQEKGAPPASVGSAVVVQKKRSIKGPRRMNFWVPASLYTQLEEEAEKQGMTMSAWVQVVLLKRPERVVERNVLPAGTKAKLAAIPTLETKVAELTRSRATLAAERDAAVAKLATLQKRIGTGKFKGKCEGCKKEVLFDLTKELTS